MSDVGTDRRSGGACLLRPGISDVNLFRYCQGVIKITAELVPYRGRRDAHAFGLQSAAS